MLLSWNLASSAMKMITTALEANIVELGQSRRQITNPSVFINQQTMQDFCCFFEGLCIYLLSLMSSQLPDSVLKHLEYLRGLHLEAPRVGNVYLEDSALREYSSLIFKENGLKADKFADELERLGDRMCGEYLEAARNAQENPPRLEQFDSYGRRIDKIHLSKGWESHKKFAAEDGIVAMAYEEDAYKLGQYQRFGQLMALYMYGPSSGLFGCPLAMTDGAAFTIKSMLDDPKTPQNIRSSLTEAFNHLTSRRDAWTSGQWMTEKKGGSDISNTETIAIEGQNGMYSLYGYKWFTSATDSNMSLGLAKILPKGLDPTPNNIAGLPVSLFYIKMRKPDNSLNNMEIVRLKDKLGTRQLPTAELLLKGTQALLISQPGKGVKLISNMLTITRIYNSATAVGAMRRGLALARDYASRRTIGKKLLSDMPLQLRVLSELQVKHRGNLILYLRMSQIFSKQQHGTIDSHQSNILRVMVPLMKLFTGKQSLSFLTEVLESFGGMGYIESSMLPSMLRDAQVLTIWQGTTNVLCYDFVRALTKKSNEHWPIQSLTHHFLSFFNQVKTMEITEARIDKINIKIVMEYNALFQDLNEAAKHKFQPHKGKDYLAELRNYCFGLTRLYIACELLKVVLLTYKSKNIEVVERWLEQGIYNKNGIAGKVYTTAMDRQLALDTNPMGEPRGTKDVDPRGKPRSRL